ncbi:MAG: hypothetical protein KC619_05980 [Myxococcales bacterium]|nr:hypothetical protein [Myxococcales bacterium]
MASLFERVTWWLRPPPEKRFDPLWIALRSRGASRELVRWAEPFGDDLDAAWAACPRAEWLIEIAARVGVSPIRVVAALDELSTHGTSRTFASARPLAGQADALELFVDAARATVSELVESRPEVRAAIDACRKLERAEHAAASQIADDTYAEAQRELASIVRRRIRADEIRVCLEGIGGHPYR